ncbi:ATP-binding cassette domain-containing protein [uncultured Corynebacterium sp.]|uniref:ATP-binding cassette domain-containing protein n=1 Tax=uncultured Corynebacterium sp. TaxID=159447 RepID=UPI0025F639C4|nr:ATP-binding cassette domain-containing protein [uncultured Corynebacterium sp.]
MTDPRTVVAGVDRLTVTVDRPLVSDATIHLHPGRVHGLVGGSGAGKSTIGRAIAGLRPRGARLDGRILGEGTAGLVPQSPASSFTPVRRLGPQLAEITGDRDGVVTLLRRVHLDPAAARLYPHQLSGGMAQRAAIAAALATRRPVLVADEPTSALDPDLTADVLALLRDLADAGLAVLLISHDIESLRASGVCDDLSVMRRGTIVEQGPAARVLTSPDHDFTRALLAALPSGGMRTTAPYERG